MTPDSSMEHITIGQTYTATPLTCVAKDADGFWCSTPSCTEPTYFSIEDAAHFTPAKDTASFPLQAFQYITAIFFYLTATIFIITRL